MDDLGVSILGNAHMDMENGTLFIKFILACFVSFFSTGHVEAFLLAISPCFLVVFPLCLLHIKLRLSFVYSWHVSGLTLINTRQVAQIIFHVYSSFHSHEITGQKNLCSLNCTLSQCLMRTVPHVVFIQYITVPWTRRFSRLDTHFVSYTPISISRLLVRPQC